MKYFFLLTLFFNSIAFNSQSENVFLLDNWTTSGLVVTNDGESIFNEVWGFVQAGQEYAVIGSANGTHILRVTEDDQLDSIDFVPGIHIAPDAVHRDYHDHNGYLYAVCDEGYSSLQIMDLGYLPDSVHVIYDSSSLIIRSHNIFIDSAKSRLYSCGGITSTGPFPMTCYDIEDPYHPVFISSYDYVDYVHDAFVRNDTAYLNCGSEGLRVVDFSDPAAPLTLGSLEFYTDKGYNHSGWLSEDGNTYVLCDETIGMRVKVLDVSDLSDIKVSSLFTTGFYENTLPHNVIVKNGIAYISYYNDGLQIFDVRNITLPKRLGYYDTYDGSNAGLYRGMWGVYPNLPSGRILCSDRKNGLYLFGFEAPPEIYSEEEFLLFPNPANNYAYFYHQHLGVADYVLSIYNSIGQKIQEYSGIRDYLFIDLRGYAIGAYIYQYRSNLSETEFSGKFIIR